MKVPITTYRLQFNRDFRFSDAQSLVRYLDELGVTDLYASPIFKARQGSMHGYDATDPTVVNPEIGTVEEFNSLVDELEFRQMGLLLDIVPNHMAASLENPYWTDVLEHGQASRYANFFDIDWSRPESFLKGKVVLPILGAPYRRVLENRELTLALGPDGFSVAYYEHPIPIDPGSYSFVLASSLDMGSTKNNADSTSLAELMQLFAELGPHRRTSMEEAVDRQQRSRTIKDLLWQLYNGSAGIRASLDESIRRFNGTKGEPESFDLLDRLLGDQAYHLCYWREALEQINYRRFFDINDLVALRVEDPTVAKATHELILRWIREGRITGLRIDHIDGLYDPAGYLAWLQEQARSVGPAAGFYVVVEKILTGKEELPVAWETAGTTGYEFIPALGGVFLDQHGMGRLRKHYHTVTGSDLTFQEVRYEKKKQIISQLFRSELKMLEEQLFALAQDEDNTRDIRVSDLSCALQEISACLPVYRTYVSESSITDEDRCFIAAAIEETQQRNPHTPSPVVAFLRKILLLEDEKSLTGDPLTARLRFVRRWQQFTGPVMAKGLEDTTHYVYNCLISQNEVGCDPAHALGREQFHAWSKSRRAHHPCSLNATATHDTKRGEDVRARIHALSELASEWVPDVDEWRTHNRDHLEIVDGKPVPDANTELLLYQTLIGAWPFSKDELPRFKERVKAYMVKASREAKVHTSWLDVHGAFEAALVSFVDRILDERAPGPFLKSFAGLQRRVAFYGALNSLSQVVAKLAVPGVPDFYQGTELWDLNLVDPDNRRPVDFVARTRSLSDLKNRDRNELELIEDLLRNWPDGRIKLYVTYRGLGFRKSHRRVFAEGDYVPLDVSGARQRHVLAFARRAEPVWVVAAVPRLSTKIVEPGEFPLGDKVWRENEICLPAKAPDVWSNIFTGETLHTQNSAGRKALCVPEVFRHLPVALLAGNANLDDFAAD